MFEGNIQHVSLDFFNTYSKVFSDFFFDADWNMENIHSFYILYSESLDKYIMILYEPEKGIYDGIIFKWKGSSIELMWKEPIPTLEKLTENFNQDSLFHSIIHK